MPMQVFISLLCLQWGAGARSYQTSSQLLNSQQPYKVLVRSLKLATAGGLSPQTLGNTTQWGEDTDQGPTFTPLPQSLLLAHSPAPTVCTLVFGDVLEIASTAVRVSYENAACFLFHMFLRVFRIVNPHPVHCWMSLMFPQTSFVKICHF